MSQSIPPTDKRLSWPGAVSLERTADWVQPWRISFEERALFHPEGLQNNAAAAAGVRIAFESDTPFVAGRIEPQEALAPMDLAVNGELRESVALNGKEGFRFDELPAGKKTLELWLPQTGRFRLRGLEIGDGASLAPHPDERPKWITYGSSISHCGGAASPARTWPAIVARGHGLNLTCLGFGGQCHLDAMIARLMRDLPADYLSMCVGINIYGASSLNERSFRAALIGSVKIIREKHPQAPFVIFSAIWSPPREAAKNNAGFTLQAMREETAATVELLRKHGDENLHYVNGLDIFGEQDAHLLPDDLHPNAEGYELMGRNFLEQAARKFFR